MFKRIKISIMKSFNQYLLENTPTNSTGSDGYGPGLSGVNPYSSIQGYDKRLFPAADDDLSQDYQTPGQSGMARWRYSNVYPVQQVTDKGIEDMVDASKEFVKMQDENTEQRVKKNFSSFMEEAPTNNVGGGQIAGTPEADPGNPPVNRKNKKKYIKLGRGSRKWWMPKSDGK